MLTHRALGAQLLQAGCGEISQLLYLSPLPVANAPMRGGVPVLFPQFAERGPLPKHGLVRTAIWNLEERPTGLLGTQRVRYSLAIEPGAFPVWPHAARLRLTIESKLDALVVVLQVTNTGSSTFNWTGGLHPYFAVQDLLACSISGLAGLELQEFSGQPFEQLFNSCGSLALNAGGYSLRLSATGFDQWMVWNPGATGATALSDLPAGHWQQFICIEPVCVDRPVVLAPGETFDGRLCIEVLELLHNPSECRMDDIPACYADSKPAAFAAPC